MAREPQQIRPDAARSIEDPHPSGNGDGTAADERGTADALLLAARKHFAAKGFDGASVRAITADAGATLGAITYHFGSKRGLYDRVIESCVVPLADRVVAAARGEGPALDRAEAVVRTYFEYLLDTPELPSLMLRELMSSGGPPGAAQQSIGRIQTGLSALVREGQAEGTIRDGDPLLLAIAMVSHPLHLSIVRLAMRAVIGIDLEHPQQRAKAIAHAVRFVRAGLENKGPTQASPTGGRP